jgi:hypothetical protein
MELETLQTATAAALSSAFTPTPIQTAVAEATATRTAVLNGEPYSLPLDPAAQLAAQSVEIAELKTRLAAQPNLTRPVELASGETVTGKEASKQLGEMSLEVELATLQTQRYIAELARSAEANTPVAAQPPLLDKDGAIKLVGRTAWEAAPNATKAAILDIRQTDLAKYHVEDYFGTKSSSLAAHELGKTNIGLYKLLRLEAVKKGLLV